MWEIGIATASPPGQRRGSEAMHEDGERRPPRPSFSPPNSRAVPPPGHLIRMILGGSVKLTVELMSYEEGVVETLDSLR